MPVVDEYLATLQGDEKRTIEHMCELVRQWVPDANEDLSYAMPAFKYQGKGLVSVIANKNFMSIYSFCAVERLGLDLKKFECTSGSIHFTRDNPIPDELFKQIIDARLQLITA